MRPPCYHRRQIALASAPMAKKSKSVLKAPFLKRLTLLPERVQSDGYPFNLPILEEGRLD